MSPPDVPTMFMLAIPMILLFELGLIMARLLIKQKQLPEINNNELI